MSSHLFSLSLRVYDEQAVACRAKEIATQTMSAEDWTRVRADHPGGALEADIIMVLDPGASPDGMSIEGSEVSRL